LEGLCSDESRLEFPALGIEDLPQGSLARRVVIDHE